MIAFIFLVLIPTIIAYSLAGPVFGTVILLLWFILINL